MGHDGEAGEARAAWRLERSAFARLLEALHPDAATASQEYERLRRRLIRLFALNGMARADEAADEAFNRLARRLSEGEQIRHIEAYLAGIARLLVLEERQRASREYTAMVRLAEPEAAEASDDEHLLELLERCLQELPPQSRQLLARYYAHDGGQRMRERDALARELGLSPNSLRNRVLRLRQKLERAFRAALEAADARDVRWPNATDPMEED